MDFLKGSPGSEVRALSGGDDLDNIVEWDADKGPNMTQARLKQGHHSSPETVSMR